MGANDPKTLAAARAQLKKGDLDGAVRLFVSAEAFDEAARALSGAQRYVEAADLLLHSLGVATDQLASLRDPHLRARAANAASLLRQAGMAPAADDLDDQLEMTSQNFGPGAEERTVPARRATLPRAPPQDEKTEVVLGRPRPPAAPTDHDTAPRMAAGRAATGPSMRALEVSAPAARTPSRPELPRHPSRPAVPATELPTPARLPAAPKGGTPPRVPPPGNTPGRVPQPAPPRRTSTGDALQARPNPAPQPGPRAARPPTPPPRAPTGQRPMLDVGFEPGVVIHDRYELGPIIGRGGMARVFKATDHEIGQEIAVKVFDRMDDPTLLQRFKHEVLLSRQISHPNVVRIFDIGTYAEQKYLTMELLVGQDLKERLAQPIALSESLDFLVQTCRGLEAAHAVGVVHRDIKPQNLFITTQRQAKVMDFGIARIAAASRLTNPGMGVGTPEYMAPEQIKDSHEVSPATDLYAVGVTAYRMCTGRVPFQDKDLLRLLKKQLNEDPPPPREVNPRLPAALEAIIVKLLSKDPARRYQSAGEVAEAFSAIRARIQAPPAG